MDRKIISLISDQLLDPASGGDSDNSSDSKLHCKFVLITSSDCIYLVFGLLSRYKYHADLVDGFCRSKAISCSWVKQPDFVEINDPSMSVQGGGYLDIDRHHRVAIFDGISRAYGNFSTDALDKLLQADPFFAAYHYKVAPR